ncbi:hypothetical protein [Saccharothrix obliqua]|uniref:hypothetical protein n=1 Tax=Saccharothrix obliqua TaxID=2861747 RepID=UPI001C5E5A9C|nr:hypothetical protein [Saccharothrix obliqua]MBW4721326.1 hypothetical protein [Saccharothrix obliqua]
MSSRVARTTGIVGLAALVLVCACGAPAQPEQITSTPPEPTTYTTPNPEPTAVPSTEVVTDTPPSGPIRIGGPRLDGRPDSTNWPLFELAEDRPTQELCSYWFNPSSVVTSNIPFTVVDVALNSKHITLDQSPKHCVDNGAAGTWSQGCRGRTLPPSGDSNPVGCTVSQRAVHSEVREVEVPLTFTAEARCPSLDGVPCSGLRGKASPTRANPVLVSFTWSRTLTVRSLPCRAADKTPDGTCPVASSPPSPTSPPASRTSR